MADSEKIKPSQIIDELILKAKVAKTDEDWAKIEEGPLTLLKGLSENEANVAAGLLLSHKTDESYDIRDAVFSGLARMSLTDETVIGNVIEAGVSGIGDSNQQYAQARAAVLLLKYKANPQYSLKIEPELSKYKSLIISNASLLADIRKYVPQLTEFLS